MQTKAILIGIGNSSRGDDALGWLVADEAARIPDMHVEYRYQLQIEDADLIKDYDIVIFADSCREIYPDGFAFVPAQAAGNITFSSHRLSPTAVVSLCQEIYGHYPEAYTLAITGTRWELGSGITREATTTLTNANRFLRDWLTHNTKGLPFGRPYQLNKQTTNLLS